LTIDGCMPLILVALNKMLLHAMFAFCLNMVFNTGHDYIDA